MYNMFRLGFCLIKKKKKNCDKQCPSINAKYTNNTSTRLHVKVRTFLCLEDYTKDCAALGGLCTEKKVSLCQRSSENTQPNSSDIFLCHESIKVSMLRVSFLDCNCMA